MQEELLEVTIYGEETAVHQIRNVFPEEARFFKEKKISIEMEDTGPEFILYAALETTEERKEGRSVVHAVPSDGSKTCQEALAELRKICEELLLKGS